MRIGGLASGMDIDQLVRDLMQAERIPLDKLNQKKIWTEWQRDAYRDVNLSLTDLRSSVEALRFQASFNAYRATSSSEGSLTATATTQALPGTYTAEVLSVARAAKMHSANAILRADGSSAKANHTIGTGGTITMKDHHGNVMVDVEITADMTYDEVAEKLEEATAGKMIELRANFDNTTSRFFIATKGMGEQQNFTLQFSTPELAHQVVNDANQTTFSTTDALDYGTAATDGRVDFDGIVIDGLTTNQTTVNGLTLNLVQPGDATTITVQSDTTKPLEAIKGFVEKYNETIETIADKLVEKRYRDFPPLIDEQKEAMEKQEIEMWEEKAKSGLLRSDPILQRALFDLRRALMDPVAGVAEGDMNLLSQIGINTGDYSEGGKLTIDEDKLNAVLTYDPDEVMALFTKSEDELGIGERVYQELNEVVKRLSDRAGNPEYLVDNSTLSRHINEMNEEMARWQNRLIQVEDRYWRQFTAMEKALNRMNQQSMWMQQTMFGGMS